MADPIAAGAAKAIAPQLYADVKSFLTSIGRSAKRAISNASLREFGHPSELLEAIAARGVQDGDRVRLRAKPSPFGPFLRSHFLTPLIGPSSAHRRGPQIVTPNPLIGMMLNFTAHLSPVGLYPSVSEDTIQGCLYPFDSPVCGMIGLMPGMTPPVPFLHALFAERHTPQLGVPSWITGAVRRVSGDVLGDAGLTPEEAEALRQSGDVWFFDATGDDSKCYSIGDSSPTELWGGLYASGHLEVSDGNLPVADLVGGLEAALNAEGYAPTVSQNKAGRREVALYAPGVRITLDTQFPMYSVHMDTELSIGFGRNREQFDRILATTVGKCQEVCGARGVSLANPLDVDFTYSNGTAALSVLRSAGASANGTPLAVAIRDWHRRRSTR